jgi:drug/metabolite transporter (DMT)-like permease
MHIVQYLKAPEAALLSMLEIVFGIGLTWIFGGETPSAAALIGGTALLLTLAWHESGQGQTQDRPDSR